MGEGLISSSVQFLRRQEKAFTVNMLRRSIENFSNTLVQQYQSIYLIALGANSVQVGLVNSLANVGSTLTALPSGWAIDRYGLKKTFYFGTIFMAVGALLFGLAVNWVYTIPAMFIFILASRVNQTSCPVVCGSSLINQDRAVGMQVCDSLASISGIIAPIVGAAVIATSGGMTAEGIRPIFFVQFGVLILELILVAWKFTNPSKRAAPKEGLGLLEGLKEVLEKGVAVKRFLLYQSIFMVPFYLNVIYIPLYAAQVKNADAFTLGGMATAALLVPLILSIPSGKLADRFGRKKVIYLCIPLYCLSLVLLATAPVGNSLMLIAAGVFQGFYVLGSVTGNAIRAEIVPISLLGSWGGLLGLFGGFVGIIVPITAGFIWGAVSPLSVLLLLVASTIIAGAVLITVPESLKLEREI
ncbi:MAG: MFS transporter [Candidatus Bathyarchaeia archaeon]|jgi:MFS family permease